MLGATGSIGASTLDVIARHPDRFEAWALTGHRRIEELAAQCRRHRPRYAVLVDPAGVGRLRELLDGCPTEVLAGPEALAEVARAPEVDAVMAAIVGAAGLAPTLAAARAGKQVLLANKESLVMAGHLFLQACRTGAATILPIDSEHNAVFQCMPAGEAAAHGGVRRVILTASGGPFRCWTAERMARATPAQACAHPNWSMGRKISVDSATMMNKGLELIEAHYLFGVGPDELEVIVHPESIVHSMVEYLDGSVLAQLGNPDMRTPIAHALAHPARIDSGVAPLSLAAIARLNFEEPDFARFPCLAHARAALSSGGAAPCVLNAANEIAVQAFLDGHAGFADIARCAGATLEALGHLPSAESLDAVTALDAEARAHARHELNLH